MILDDIGKLLSGHCLDGGVCDRWRAVLTDVSSEDVRLCLASRAGVFNLERLAVLISDAAGAYLEEMASQAQSLTVQRFGRTVQMYAPLYISNYCVNRCRYCAYNAASDFERTRLTVDEAMVEAELLAGEGFRHILLVSGEDRSYVTVDYLVALARRLRGRFSSISIEIYAMDEHEYARLFDAGIDGVTLYQESYDRGIYAENHPSGPKRDYNWRLGSHCRSAGAGMRQLGLGVLLGLSDWRMETLAMALHADWLMRNYWRSRVSFSFPRMRPAAGIADGLYQTVSDRELVQMMLALRLCFADAGIVLSTRESAEFRDNVLGLCVTQMSAGSKTNPGGYSGRPESTKQFEIDDCRVPGEVASVIAAAGLQPMWKDWDKSFTA